MSGLFQPTCGAPVGAFLFVALLAGFPVLAECGEVLFEPYRCQTAIVGVAFDGPPAKLANAEAGVRFDLSRGPSGLAVDSTTGAPHWPAPVEGRHVVRVKATAGQAWDEVEWILRVVPREADDLVVYSTKYLDFVVTRRHLEGNEFLRRKYFIDGIWECFYRLIGQEPLNDLQVVRWNPKIGGALAGNPIQFGGGPTWHAAQWHENEWERLGLAHELAHNFNFLIRTPGKWSSSQFAEGYNKNWLDRYFHHICSDNLLYQHRMAVREPQLFGLSPAEAGEYRNIMANYYWDRNAAQHATSLKKLIAQGKTMQDGAAAGYTGAWAHQMSAIADKDGIEVVEKVFRAMRHDGLPPFIFSNANTPEKKFSLFVSLLSAAAKRDLRPQLAEGGFVVEKRFYELVHPQVEVAMERLPPKEEWVNGWIKSPVTGRYYRVMRWVTDWEQANRTARQWGGRLIHADSQRDHKWLGRRYGHLGPVWLGLRDVDGKQTWTWTSGDKAYYLPWKPDAKTEPNAPYVVMTKERPWEWRCVDAQRRCVVLVERDTPPGR